MIERIDALADEVVATYEMLGALVGQDAVVLHVVRHYASVFAQYQLERVHQSLHQDNQFGSARAARAHIDALIEYEQARADELAEQ